MLLLLPLVLIMMIISFYKAISERITEGHRRPSGADIHSRHDLIELHKARLQTIEELKKKTIMCRKALYMLEDMYNTSAGACPCCRYVELRDMIK